jgi:Tfp pilus assembly protein PilF
MAGLYDLEKNLYEAASVFEKILELDGSQARAYMGLARIYTRQGKFDEAESQLLRAVTWTRRRSNQGWKWHGSMPGERILTGPRPRLKLPSN